MKTRGIKSNVVYSLASVWKADRSLFLLFLFHAFLMKVYPFILIFFPKVLLDRLGASPVSFGHVVATIVPFILLSMVVLFLQRYVYGMTSIRFMTYRLDKERELSSKTTEIEYENLENSAVLDAYNRAMQACSSWNTGMEGMLRETMALTMSVFSAVGFIAILLTLNWLVCVGLILVSALNHFLQMKLGDVDVKYREELSAQQRRTQYYSNVMTEPHVGKDIRLFQINSFLQGKFRDAADHFLKLRHAAIQEKNPILALTYLVDVGKVGGFFAYLIFRAASGAVGVGSFMMYISTFANFTDWFDEILSSATELKRMTRETDDYRSLMELPTIEEKEKTAIDHIESIEFRDVWFRYGNAKEYVLKGISFAINPNESISLVGVNGSGKTTIVKLVCGFYLPTKGEILINGIPMRNIDRKSLHEQLALVSQDVNVFAFSIAANIALCERKKIDAGKAAQSLQRTGFGRILDKVPRGIDTIVQKILDDEGIELSGGENQGIAIARAIYKDQASAVILDEPASHLDALMESRIYRTYHEIGDGRISLFISHRLASAQFCDRVMFIENGALLGLDSHARLMANNVKYRDMYDVQARYYREECEAQP